MPEEIGVKEEEMDITAAIMEIVTGPEAIAIIALMAANVALSIIAAISKGVFSFRNLGDFVGTRVVPLIAYVIVGMLAQVVGEWTAVVIAVYAGLVALYSAGILAGLKSLTGLNIPDIFSEKK